MRIEFREKKNDLLSPSCFFPFFPPLIRRRLWCAYARLRSLSTLRTSRLPTSRPEKRRDFRQTDVHADLRAKARSFATNNNLTIFLFIQIIGYIYVAMCNNLYIFSSVLIFKQSFITSARNYFRFTGREFAGGSGRVRESSEYERGCGSIDDGRISTRLVSETSKCSRCCTGFTTWPTYEATRLVSGLQYDVRSGRTFAKSDAHRPHLISF